MVNWHKILDIRQGKFNSDFRQSNTITPGTKGETYLDEEQTWCNLTAHESIFDIIETLKHEDRHCALKREDMTDDREHYLLRLLAMIENNIILLD